MLDLHVCRHKHRHLLIDRSLTVHVAQVPDGAVGRRLLATPPPNERTHVGTLAT